MDKERRISAVVSATVHVLLEKQARATGVKKGHLVEQALLHHLRALDALPADALVLPRIVISRRSGAEIRRRLAAPRRPTKQLRALLGDDGD